MFTFDLKTKLILLFFLLEQASCHNNPRSLPPLIEDCANVDLISYGVYRIQPDPLAEPFPVFCEVNGFLVIQQRFDGSVNFMRNWEDYKNGFGNISHGGEFWLGLDKIYALTSRGQHYLVLEVTDFNGNYWSGGYDDFAIGDESEQYELKSLGQFLGSVDCLSAHVGKKFSTFDNDNDELPQQNCAVRHQGAGWYSKCYTGGSNLNGRYENAVSDLAITCMPIGNPVFRGLKYTRLSIRKLNELDPVTNLRKLLGHVTLNSQPLGLR